MAFAQGNQSRLAFGVETTFGTASTDSTYQIVPFNSHSLELSKETIESEEIRNDRQTKFQRHGQRQIGGDVTVDMRFEEFDDFIESAMFNSFDTSGAIEIGTSPKYLTFEEEAIDIGIGRRFIGCAVDSWSLSVAPNSIVTSTFSFVGKDEEIETDTSNLAATDSKTDNDLYDSFTGQIKEGGSTIAIVTSLDLTLNNSLAPTFVIGDQTTPQLEYGRGEVSGTMEVYFEDDTFLSKFKNETETSIEFVLDDGVTGQAYTFTLPRVKLNSASAPVENEQSRLISIDFVALKDTTEATNFKIVKS